MPSTVLTPLAYRLGRIAVVLFVLTSLSLSASAQDKPQGPVSQELLDLKAEYDAFVAHHPPEAFTPSHPLIQVKNGLVLVDATATDDAWALLAELKALGLQGGGVYGNMVSGSLPIEAIDELADLEHLRYIRASMGATRGAVSPDEVPHRFAFEQNYPNPFKRETVLPFAVAEQVRVRLAIYDLLGRERDVLTERTLAPGLYEVTWDAAGLPSGRYLARMRSGSGYSRRWPRASPARPRSRCTTR